MEEQIVQFICPGHTVAEAEGKMGPIREETAKRLLQRKVVDSADLLRTKYRCKNCKNFDQGAFREDRYGQVTCMQCGWVVQDRKIEQTNWQRQFSGEGTVSQFGPAPDQRMSSGFNLSTSFSGGTGIGAGSKVTKGELETLKRTQAGLDMGLSKMMGTLNGTGGLQRTRVGYKDAQKRKQFILMEETAAALHVPDKAVEAAKGHFADFRDSLDTLRDPQLVTAACLILALRTVTEPGASHLKRSLDDAQQSQPGAKRANVVPASASSSASASASASAGSTAVSSAPATISASAISIVREKKRERTFEELHPFACKYCDEVFGNKKDMRMHTKSCPKKPLPPPPPTPT